MPCCLHQNNLWYSYFGLTIYILKHLYKDLKFNNLLVTNNVVLKSKHTLHLIQPIKFKHLSAKPTAFTLTKSHPIY